MDQSVGLPNCDWRTCRILGQKFGWLVGLCYDAYDLGGHYGSRCGVYIFYSDLIRQMSVYLYNKTVGEILL